jgi:hypothetical protein
VPLPDITESGDLPPGVHRATLQEAVDRFGKETPRRKVMALRLERIYSIAQTTGHLARCVVFGSFVTDKPDPKDVDVFLLMENSFRVDSLAGELRLLFDHAAAQAHFGCSVFWLRRLAAFPSEQAAVEDWQMKRDGTRRGIVEIIPETP